MESGWLMNDDEDLVSLALKTADLTERLDRPAIAGLLHQLAHRVAKLSPAEVDDGLSRCRGCGGPLE